MKMMTKIKDFWEDFYYMNEGSSPKYFINQCICGIWFAFFIGTMLIAGTLGALFYEIQCWWYKLRGKDYVKDVLRKRHGL